MTLTTVMCALNPMSDHDAMFRPFVSGVGDQGQCVIWSLCRQSWEGSVGHTTEPFLLSGSDPVRCVEGLDPSLNPPPVPTFICTGPFELFLTPKK